MSAASNTVSRDLLNAARAKKTLDDDQPYSSSSFRATMKQKIEKLCKVSPYDWQLDVSEALCLGLDTLLLAATGEGKSLPFIAPLLHDNNALILIISPLNALEEDLAKRFTGMGFPSIAVNGETWNAKLRTNIENRMHRVLLTSPELALKNVEFRKMISNPSLSKDIRAVIIDEAHCIQQWGGANGFRADWGEVGRLRALVPPSVPFLATTATATPEVQRQIRTSLQFGDDTTYFVNDRHNITSEVHKITHTSSDYSDLDFVVDDALADDREIQKTMIFVDSISETHKIATHLRSRLPNLKRREIAVYHALRTGQAKKKVMRDFRRGKIRVLVTTDACGMGADIPDVELVVQFKVPASLSIWIQRAGRAARSPHIKGRAMLFVEKSVFEIIRPRSKNPPSGDDPPEEVEPLRDREDDNENDDAVSKNATEQVPVGRDGTWRYRKTVEAGLRAYIETMDCRRIVSDQYFDNPERIKALTVVCCDNCEKKALAPQPTSTAQQENATPTNRPTTPVSPPNPEVNSVHSTPSRNHNENGKRPMVLAVPEPDIKPVGARRDKRLAAAREALNNWRHGTWLERYPHASFGPKGLLPDVHLTTIASGARIITLDDLGNALKPRWVFLSVHGPEVLAVVKKADEDFKAEQDQLRDAKKENAKRLKVEQQEREKLEKSQARKAVESASQPEDIIWTQPQVPKSQPSNGVL
ncbi:P-loop containing nucleoside triphosphate hydrolase protein [Rickenella mellea]|uniref:DNA 3'-5' helicase n=1 Tax=Rickenella mellea TaxID=50990 RepID=A0A4Y7PQ98_9AGAM|nr:P-loop containing nucleoside triphosphate hydrolase protein [Rickenella mellea]